ncbi:MAG: hypothetical protein AAFN78_02395 [Pseudomonadota bacterium]
MGAALLAALLFDYRMLGRFLRRCDAERNNRSSLHDSATAALRSLLKWPLLARLLETELLTLYYACFARLSHSDPAAEGTQFSYEQTANARDVYLFVALSQLPFVPLIHLLLESKKGPGVAWVVTLLTLWSVVWYLAQVQAVRFRPLQLQDGQLRYRFGLIWAADIPVENIRLAREIDVAEQLDPGKLFLSPLGSRKTVLIEFDAPVVFTGPYLLKKRRRKAAIAVDEPSQFLAQLARRGARTS